MKKERYWKYASSVYDETDERGRKKSYGICSCCGKFHRHDYGFEIDWSWSRDSGRVRLGLCTECAKKLMPIMLNAIDKVRGEKERLRQKAEREPKEAEQIRLEAACQRIWNTMWEEFDDPVD